MRDEPAIAILIPCLNEEAAIGKVVNDFKTALPRATIFVYDNHSTDRTAEIAIRAGATVRTELRAGKGNVVRRMFADVDADVYVLVDGDDTYDASVVRALIGPITDSACDMVVARRIATNREAYRAGHRLGNRFLTGLVARLFGAPVKDMLSGYRAFSKRFVKTFPSSSREFEIETELTIHALQMRMATSEQETSYKERPSHSASKLRTFRDGFRILATIFNLVRNERPLLFFSVVAVTAWILGLWLGIPILNDLAETHSLQNLPKVVACAALLMSGVIALATGLILDVVAHLRLEAKRLAYLTYPPPPGSQPHTKLPERGEPPVDAA